MSRTNFMESFFRKQILSSTKRPQEDSLLLRFGIKVVSSLTTKIFAKTGAHRYTVILNVNFVVERKVNIVCLYINIVNHAFP